MGCRSTSGRTSSRARRSAARLACRCRPAPTQPIVTMLRLRWPPASTPPPSSPTRPRSATARRSGSSARSARTRRSARAASSARASTSTPTSSSANNVKIQNNVSIYVGVTIEDGVFVGPHVCFTNDKVPRAVNPDMSLKGADDWQVTPTLVKAGAALGANSTIVCGVTVGKWAMVALGLGRHEGRPRPRARAWATRRASSRGSARAASA